MIFPYYKQYKTFFPIKTMFNASIKQDVQSWYESTNILVELSPRRFLTHNYACEHFKHWVAVHARPFTNFPQKKILIEKFYRILNV